MSTMIAAPPQAPVAPARRADDAYLRRLDTNGLVRLSLRYRALSVKRALLPGEIERRGRIERALKDRDRDRR